jgi:hypothetical protein
MAPQKFASVRYKSRPTVLIPFRDDTGLVGLPYEHTKQAEPPIPIPARNPLRSSPTTAITPPPRPMSTPVGTSAAGGGPPLSTIFSPPTYMRAITVLPTPPPQPPQEEHPAFRNDFSSSRHSTGGSIDNWKRDSGLAPTASSGTIYEEDLEDPVAYPKEVDTADHNAARAVTPSDIADDSSSTYSSAEAPNMQRQKQLPTPPPEPVEACSPANPAPSRSTSRRIARSFSFRTTMPNRLRKKSVGDDDHHSRGTAMVAPDGPLSPLPSPTEPGPRRSLSTNDSPSPQQGPHGQQVRFEPLAISIPTGHSLLEEDFMSHVVSFSKRGSLMFGGKRALPGEKAMDGDGSDSSKLRDDGAENRENKGGEEVVASRHEDKKNLPKPQQLPPPPNIRVLPAEVEKESQKVRSFYDAGDATIDWEREGGGGHRPGAEAGEAPTSSSSSSLAGEGPSHHPPEELSFSVEKNEHDPYDFLAVPHPPLRSHIEGCRLLCILKTAPC